MDDFLLYLDIRGIFSVLIFIRFKEIYRMLSELFFQVYYGFLLILLGFSGPLVIFIIISWLIQLNDLYLSNHHFISLIKVKLFLH